MALKATYYGANGWLIEFDKVRILIDPWLNGDLTFPPGDWLIKGKLSKEVEVPKDIDFLLLTQGQPDHTHPPTLGKINKAIPVVASEAATKIVKRIKSYRNFTNGRYYITRYYSGFDKKKRNKKTKKKQLYHHEL